MKIALIQVNVLDIDNLNPPLGILYIGTILKNKGHEVKCFDEDPEHVDLIPKLREFNPDAIGLSFMTPSYERAYYFCKSLRKKFKHTTIFAGGIHPTISSEKTMKEMELDFIVIGEGERTICEALENIGSLKNVKGIMYRKDGKIINNKSRELIKNLDEIPIPDRNLIENYKEKYIVYPGMIRGHPCKTTTVITSRGCPYNCLFCCTKLMFGQKTRYRSIDNVIEEIKGLVKNYNIEGIWFADDTFTLDEKRVIEFCRALKKENLKLVWACQARVNTLTENMLKEMKEAGCIQLDFGIESGSDKILKVLKKNTNVEMIKNAFKLTKKHKMRTLATFMVNNPYETKEDLKMTLRLAKEIKSDFTTFFFCTPFPGTEVYKLAEEKGWLKDSGNFSDKWNVRTGVYPVMSNDNITKEELIKIKSKMQNTFFIRNYVYSMNIKFTIRLMYQLLKQPKLIFKTLRELKRTKKIDRAFEVIFSEVKL